MDGSESKLVLVAHPGDEVFAFSHVCAGSDIVSVTNGGGREHEAVFRRVCELLGGKRALLLNLPDVPPHRLPIEALVERLRELGSYRRIYTHSPLEKHAQHRDVALAASQYFAEVWVRTYEGYASEVHVLSQPAFGQKLDIINSFYPYRIAASADDDRCCVAEAIGVEAFTPTRFLEVSRAFAHSSAGILSEVSDVWAFETSPYEQERYNRTCTVLAYAAMEEVPTSILEVGACEGTMTRRLRTLFPSAKIRAVEPNPVFAQRLRDALGDDPDIEIIEASILDVPLSADLVLMAEVLYFAPEHLMDILGGVRAKYVLTSYVGSFDDRVSLYLHRYGWHNVFSVQVLPRFEPVDGSKSFLVVQRPGSNIRLWKLT
jgi:Nodulation protein S (NodS)